MSGNRRLPIAALYDPQTDSTGLTDMMGSFDLDAYGAQEAVELKNLLALVDREPSTSGTGAVPSVHVRSRSVPRQPASWSTAGASQLPETPVSTHVTTPASMFIEPLAVQASKDIKREDTLGSALRDNQAPQAYSLRDARSLSPTTTVKESQKHASKAERVREKNRLAQARFRQKQREEVQGLEGQVVRAQELIEDTKRKCIAAQKLKHDVNTRLSRAADMLLALEQCTCDMDVCTSPPDLTAPPDKLYPAQSAPASIAAFTNSTKTKHLPPLISTNSSPPISTVVPLAGRFGYGRGKSRRPVHSYKHHASIAMECITISSEEPFSFGAQVERCKSEQAEKIGSLSKETCWFIQQPFELPNGQLLSMSSCLGSYTCTLAILLYILTNFLKATNYDRELKLFDKGLMVGIEDMDTSTSKQTRSGGSSRAGSAALSFGNIAEEPQRKRPRPDSAEEVVLTCSLAERPLVDTRDPCLDTLTVRCGVNEECLLADSARHILGNALREHREHMPREAWLECCQVFLRFIDQCAGRSEDEVDAGSPSDPEAEESKIEDLQGFPKSCALLFQIVADTVLATVAADNDERQWEPSEHRRRQAVEQAELNIKSWGFTWCMLLMDAPRTAREMAVHFGAPSHRSFEQVEETHLRMYRSMHLSSEQRGELATLWREWQRRRHMLDRDHHSAMSNLEALPAADDINDSFILLVSALCSGNKAAVTTAATALDLPFQGVLDTERTSHQFLGISPDATTTGTEAIRILREASERDNRVQVDMYSLWIQHHMTTKQKLRFFATIVESQVVAMELQSILQTAAFQRRRDELYSSQVQ